MNAEKLEQANSLSDRIKEIKNQIDSLTQSHSISESKISTSTGYLYTKFVDFKLLKTITLAQLQEQLSKLETEFNNL